MLHPSKSQSILQWFNSLTTKDSVLSITHFADGCHFYDIINSIYTYGKIENVPQLASSIESVTTETKENVSEKGTEIDGNSSVKTDTVQKNYEAVEKFIDDFFQLESKTLVSYVECINGKDLELAKVAVLLLSAMVQSFLSTENQLIYTTTLLDPQVQEDIKELLSLALSMENEPPRKTEFHRLLSRPAKYKGSPRRRVPSRAPDQTETPDVPKGIPKKRRDRVSVIPDEIIESPLKSLLESPQIQHKAALFKKEAEISKVRNALHTEEMKVVDLILEKRTLNDELEKKRRELDFVKEESRKFRELADERDSSKQSEIDELVSEKERNILSIQDFKEELKEFKKENEELQSKIAAFEESLVERMDVPSNDSELLSKILELEATVIEKDRIIAYMTDRANSLETDLKLHEDLLAEITSGTAVREISDSRRTMSPMFAETLSNIVVADEKSQLKEKDVECTNLRQRLLEEMEKSKALEKAAKATERDFKSNSQNIRCLQVRISSLLDDLDSSRKDAINYKNMLNNCVCTNLSSSKNSTFQAMDSNVIKTEPHCEFTESSETPKGEEVLSDSSRDLGKLWDNLSTGRGPETRRSKSSICMDVNARESMKFIESSSNYSCRETEFITIRKLARSVAKLIRQNGNIPEVKLLNSLEEVVKSLNTVSEILNVFQCMVDCLKSMKIAAASKSPLEKRTRRSTAAEDVDPNLVELQEQIRNLEKEVDGSQLELKQQQVEHKIKLKEKEDQIKKMKDLCEKMQFSHDKLNEEVKQKKKELKDANLKYEDVKKYVKKMNYENQRLIEVVQQLRKEAEQVSIKKPCRECAQLHAKLFDLKQERNILDRDMKDLKAVVKHMEGKMSILQRQIKDETSEREKLEFQIQREKAFMFGSMSDRNAVIQRYFQNGIAESKKAQKQAEKTDKKPQVLNVNTYIIQPEKKDIHCEISLSSGFANKSLRSGFLQTDDEEDFLNHSSLAEIQRDTFSQNAPNSERFQELQRRNTLCLPHLQSSYPLEMNVTPSEKKYHVPGLSHCKVFESDAERDLHRRQETEFLGLDWDDSQDTGHFSLLKKRKIEKDEPVASKKVVRTSFSSASLLTRRGKPFTPVRKIRTLSRPKPFKTPSSIRRLMKIPRKNKLQ